VLTYSHQALRDITLDTMRTWRAELQRELDTTWIDGLSEAHVRHRCLLVEADTVAKGLLQVLEREHADLVVLGVHSRESLAGRLLSSTSHALAHHAQVPVVVVPDGWTA
jgi:nucleotide-binding universal stress UspA family protein